MIPLKKDFQHGNVSLKVTLSDDLWYLTHLIAPGDEMTMKTERKLKIGSSETNAKNVRKQMVLTLRIESIDLSEAEELRTKGIVLSGPEEVPHGVYHTFGIRINDSFTLHKNVWSPLLIDRLNEALTNSAQTTLVVQYDREHALFSLIKQTGIKHVAELKVTVPKKQYVQSANTSLYEQILVKVNDYLQTHKISGIVFASADFWRPYVQEKLPATLKRISTFISTPEVAKSSVRKLLMRPELHQLFANQRLQKEQAFVALVLKKLDADFVSYGFSDVQKASKAGAIQELGVTEKFLDQSKQDESYNQLDDMLKTVHAAKGKVLFLHTEEATKIINGLGGIVGILRWKTE